MNNMVYTLILLLQLVPLTIAQIRMDTKVKTSSDREEHGLLGPVATIRYEWCVLAIN